ncbi:MAG: hypothetical protein ACON4U_05310 [Myxococcota bacterium]
MPTITPFRLCCYMLMTIGLCTCFSSILWYAATADSVLNEMYIQRKGINAAHMVFRWLILAGASIAILGAVPLMIILFKKWEISPENDSQPVTPQSSLTTKDKSSP